MLVWIMPIDLPPAILLQTFFFSSPHNVYLFRANKSHANQRAIIHHLFEKEQVEDKRSCDFLPLSYNALKLNLPFLSEISSVKSCCCNKRWINWIFYRCQYVYSAAQCELWCVVICQRWSLFQGTTGKIRA